jgi:hypothetical protein
MVENGIKETAKKNNNHIFLHMEIEKNSIRSGIDEG